MKRELVKSWNIHSIWYWIFSSKLEIEFTDGCIYQYLKVPFEVYNSLMTSPCFATYIDRNIKKSYKRKIIKDDFMF